ncbi:MAG: carbohydrate kinase family protein [Candidatus Heimdallarchaeota archaeon]
MKITSVQEPAEWLARLGVSLARVERKLSQKRCVCLPDFFIDILLFMPMPVSNFLEIFHDNLRGEGRNIYASRGRIVPGGNAFNTARTLATLGCSTAFIGESDEFGSAIAAKVAFDIPELELLLRISDRLNSTTAVEIQDEKLTTHNIQLSVAEALRNWGPEELTSQDEEEISKADLVYFSNWGVNTYGNDLLERILEIAAGMVMFDPGNVFAGKQRIEILLELLQNTHALSLNFDEFNFLEKQTRLLHSNISLESHLENTTIFIHGHTKVKILQKGKQTEIPTFKIEPRVQTGLGDSFAAGAAAGLLSGISAPEAAVLGSSVAGHYAKSLILPNIEDIELFLQKEKLRSLIGPDAN